MNTTRVLALLPLFVVLAHSFSWDIVVGGEKQLKFFHNGTLTHTEDIPSAHAVTYDPVHFRVLFIDYQDLQLSISSFDLTTRKIQTLGMKRTRTSYDYLSYDPVTQLLFWTEDYEIHSLSLIPTSSNKSLDGNLFVTLDEYCGAIAIDSCGGYIYWVTTHNIERAAFDGSERKVLLDAHVFWRRSLAIDQQTEKMYWIEETERDQHSIESADLNGKNRRTIYFIGTNYLADALTVSKDFIFWRSYNQRAILQLPKHHQQGVAPVVYSVTSRDCWLCQVTAANYTIEEQTLGNKSCEALKSPLLDVEERHSSICHNYCFQGNCIVSAEGHPKCRCKTGYSGERCEVNACYMYCLNNGVCYFNKKDKPVCHCTAAYEGERCDVSICKDYCFHGNCSVDSEGRPKCSCDSGYSGERCEVNPCAEYCLNDGACSLNDEHQPVCRCTAGYEGARCDVSICKDLSFQAACSVSADGQPKVTVTLGRTVESSCAATHE